MPGVRIEHNSQGQHGWLEWWLRVDSHRGEEVTDWVMDHEQSIVFDQAENRMWAQMSLMTYLINEGAWDAMGEFMGLE